MSSCTCNKRDCIIGDAPVVRINVTRIQDSKEALVSHVSCLIMSRILFLAFVLALGQAAPAGSRDQHYYHHPYGQEAKVSKQQSVKEIIDFNGSLDEILKQLDVNDLIGDSFKMFATLLRSSGKENSQDIHDYVECVLNGNQLQAGKQDIWECIQRLLG